MKYEVDAKDFGSYDVVVCGGGTAGCFAAIAAARQGANTLLIERSFTVGGMLTVGEAGITKFTEHCKAVDRYKKEVLYVLGTNPKKVQVVGGIANEYVKKMIDSGAALGTHGEAGSYVFTDKAEHAMLRHCHIKPAKDLFIAKALVKPLYFEHVHYLFSPSP